MKKEIKGTRQESELNWKQHFPTYQFKNRDIALEEYISATKILEAEERVFLNATNLTVVVGAALGSLALGSLDRFVVIFTPVFPKIAVLLLILMFAFFFGILSLRYFADRQKAIVFSARKVIVLRRMLGMSYGNLQLVLPNSRIEGADEPFSVRLFPGWHTYVIYPCYVIAGISSAVAFYILVVFFKDIESTGWPVVPWLLIIGLTAAWFAYLCLIYRNALLDTHERRGLLVIQKISKALGLRLVGNFEYVIYRATLARYELRRLGIDLSLSKKILIYLEDKEFYHHSGISLRGLTRMALSMTGLFRRSGGSTITQQLVRTLFIHDQSKLVRRKLVEILLALWFDRVVGKSEQLELYLASVRFESGVFGMAAGMNHFFGKLKKSISLAEAFFLVERVSNIRSRLLVEKIDQSIRSALVAGVIDRGDAEKIIKLYVKMVNSEKIQDPDNFGIKRLENAWC